MGRVPFPLKMQYKNLFLRYRGKIPEWGLDPSQLLAEKLFTTWKAPGRRGGSPRRLLARLEEDGRLERLRRAQPLARSS